MSFWSVINKIRSKVVRKEKAIMRAWNSLLINKKHVIYGLFAYFADYTKTRENENKIHSLCFVDILFIHRVSLETHFRLFAEHQQTLNNRKMRTHPQTYTDKEWHQQQLLYYSRICVYIESRRENRKVNKKLFFAALKTENVMEIIDFLPLPLQKWVIFLFLLVITR